MFEYDNDDPLLGGDLLVDADEFAIGADVLALVAEAAKDLTDLPEPAPVMSSVPVYTVEATPDYMLTVIRVDCGAGRRESYQVYLINDENAVLVALAGLYVDSLIQLRAVRRVLLAGCTLEQWVERHPDGITPV